MELKEFKKILIPIVIIFIAINIYIYIFNRKNSFELGLISKQNQTIDQPTKQSLKSKPEDQSIISEENDCAKISSNEKISVIGEFSNIRYTEEHGYGYDIMLWHIGDCLFGLFTATYGLQADMPMGRLHDVKYDKNNGTLSFSAKLTIGETGTDSGFEPSRDLFIFKGNIDSEKIYGTLTNSDQVHNFSKDEYITLNLTKRETNMMDKEITYQEWFNKWEEILKFRGPKW